jgi:hypothetical protein
MLRNFNRLTPIAAAVIVAVTTLTQASVAAADGSKVIADCNTNGYLSGHYSRSDLQSALGGMGADVKEYTNCYDVISRALAVAAAGGARGGGGGGSSSGGPGGTGATARAAGVSTRGIYSQSPQPADAGPGSKAAVRLSGADVSPGSSGVGAGSNSRSLPTPLLVVLIALGLAAAGGGGVAVRRRVVARGG